MSRRDFGGCGGNAALNDEPAADNGRHRIAGVIGEKSLDIGQKVPFPLYFCFLVELPVKSPQIVGFPTIGR